MWNSQERHTDAKSMASTGGPVAWNSNQMQNSRASTGQPVTQYFFIDVDLQVPRECNLSAESVSFRERVDTRLRMMLNRPPVDEMNDIDKHSFILGIFMSSSMKVAVFLQRDYSEDLHFIRNKNEKPIVKKLFEVTQN